MADQPVPDSPEAATDDIPILVLDESGRVISYSPRARQMLGLSAQSYHVAAVAIGSENGSTGDAIITSEGSANLRVLVGSEGERIAVRGTALALDGSLVGQPLTLLVLDQRDYLPCGSTTLSSAALAEIAQAVHGQVSSLVASLEILLREHRTLRQSEIGKIVRVLWRNVCSLEHVIDNVLVALNLFAGRFQLDLKPLRLADLFDETAEMAAALADSRHQSLAIVLPEAHATVRADRRRVMQVLANLVSSAFHEAPIESRVTLTATETGSNWQIGISSRGPARGKSRSAPPALDTLPISGQFDLGLAVTKALVQFHGGSMGLVTRPEQGNTRWFTLPSATEAAVFADSNTPELPANGVANSPTIVGIEAITLSSAMQEGDVGMQPAG